MSDHKPRNPYEPAKPNAVPEKAKPGTGTVPGVVAEAAPKKKAAKKKKK